MHLTVTFWRRSSQLLCLTFFLFLFFKTDYSGADELNWAVNLIFRIDPFLALASMLAGKEVIFLMLPAVATLLLTVIFSRFFCGWACPMGTLIDGCGCLLRPIRKNTHPGRPEIKYYLLFFLIPAALFGLPIAGYIDPFSLLVRGLTFALHPALDTAATRFFTFTYQHAPDWVNALTEPVYAVMKRTVLPATGKLFSLSLVSLFLLLLVIGLSRLERRFFCRKVCPLGALLALCSRISPIRLSSGSASCGKCQTCRTVCRMGAIDEKKDISNAECILCLDCMEKCPKSRFSYGWKKPDADVSRPAGISRRAFLASVTAGAAIPLVLPARPLAKHPDPLLIRPPGSLAETAFLGRCVRCGECMKVCIGNALHPVFLEAGVEGIFTPRLIGRTGYCEYNCTLCGQACPTGAIRLLLREEKHAIVIGRAYFDKNRCLPYADGVPCIVCEEHCPTPDKAIKFREVQAINAKGELATLRQPYVVAELCIGCGICEHECPVTGLRAIRVTAENESRSTQRTITT